ncbi:peptide deformylase [Frankia sp. CNm7]|uniref:Peptide deformylase n=1 Tax=Frankia nepalensis TaxID=1836974 RepID=A0A937RL11_9ACTN|nr:peptide deformylase [Frankia nepalensis]MBL7498492.1 peptide deformylase [Frankia nepalensis]MBL7509654.1 peptide deformylase [Frankia nepalensis]MBL7524544.1 peptide deformylase [Frankia nepalensis]MBL7630850.1 peptide deformylase [Frankia nepalensis]
MTVLPIRLLGDPVLRTPARPVTDFDAALRRLVDDMIETMYAAPGVGLAAPQVGVGLRLFVFDTDWLPGGRETPAARRGRRSPRVVVNPVLEREPGDQSDYEGCLSVPGYQYSTPRAATATVRGVDTAGEPVEYSGTGFLARCLQHESDHLDGTLYLDRLTGLNRRAAQRALRDAVLSPQDAARGRADDGPGGFLSALRRR